jgi:hypothetical protein
MSPSSVQCRLICLLLLIASSSSGAENAPQTTLPGAATPPALSLLERLMTLPPQGQVLQTSSHNPTGRNGDANWALYRDAHGDNVIFDAAGPGCVRSMWGTAFAPDAVLKFYFDGQAEPRYAINEIEFYSGKHPDFPPPLASYELRGHYNGDQPAGNCCVPIPFNNSLKIAIAGEARFYHVIYELYPHGTQVTTFTGKEDRAALVASFQQLGATPVLAAGTETVEAKSDDAGPGREVVLFERKDAAGIIRGIELEADGSEAFFQDTELSVRWDGQQRDAVRAPTGIFFGCANHACDVASLGLAVKKLPGGRARLSCCFPMPFWHAARIVWRNTSNHPLGPLVAKVSVEPNAIPQARGTYFTALFHKGETTYSRDWPFFDSPGAGWFVGVVQSMQNAHYCEGNEHFSIDGALSPQINGTGTEDYYLGCFWPNLEYSSPFASCAGDIQQEGGGHMGGAYRIPSSYGRFHLEAPIPFFRALDARIQHGGQSDVRSNYRSLAFCYLRAQPALRETDFIAVGNPASEAVHRYQASTSELSGLVTASPEGDYFETALVDSGRRHAGGEITFTVATNPENAGVRLRRRLDQAGPPQAAEVYVDGNYAGRWLHASQNPHLRWYESDFDLHPQHTRGKQSLTIKLVVTKDAERGPFTDFNYRVYCFEADASGR